MIRRDLIRPAQGEWTVQQTPANAPSLRVTTFDIYLQDADNEPLALRMFLKRNYREALADLSSAANTASVTLVPATIQGLCDDKVNQLPGTYLLELFVSDRGFAEADPSLLSPPVPEEGGYLDTISWDIVCVESVTQ